MRTTIRLFGVAWAIIITLLAIAAGVSGDYLSVVALLISAALAFPVSWRMLGRDSFRPNRAIKAIVVIGMALLGVSIAAFRPGPPKGPLLASQGRSVPATLATPAQVPVTSKQPEQPQRDDREQSAAKLARLIADERTLDRDDIFNRIIFWKEIAAFAPANRAYANTRDELQAQVDEVERLVSLPSLGAEIVKIRPRKEGFGNVLIMEVTIRNHSQSNLKDFQIRCENKGASGTVINTNVRSLFEVVEARSTKTFRGVNMGLINPQSKSTNCEIDEATVS